MKNLEYEIIKLNMRSDYTEANNLCFINTKIHFEDELSNKELFKVFKIKKYNKKYLLYYFH
jgi:hypothetical protein